jgi:cytochrome P450
MSSTLTSDDPRYRELFDPAKEASANGGQVLGDLTLAMNALRDRAPVQKGSLRELLGLADTHAMYNRRREHYTLLDFKSCERGFRENLLFSSEVYKESPGVQMLGETILQMTGDEHRRRRAVVQPMFVRPKAKTWWEQNWIHEAVQILLDRFSAHDAADLNLELCARLPVYIVTRGMGLSGDEALNFREHLLRGTIGATGRDPAQAAHSYAEVARMLKELIAARRAHPGDDVVTGLINNEFQLADGGTRKLTDEEIFGYCRLIILAGGGTTWRQLGITLHALLTHYRFWEACRADRKMIEPAIEEGARWRPTDPTFPRLMMQDVELEGVLIPAGARVDLCLGAANRDPARWENPDEYDIYRPTKHYHLGFGLGPHQCLGMNVAKQEMITSINALMDRFPNMHLDPDATPAQLVGGLEQRGMTAVPVRFR